jgi:HK97 family phage portal protein
VGLASTFRRRRLDRSEDRALTRETLPSVYLPEQTSGEVPGIRAAAGIADVFACVKVLERGAEMAPLRCYRKGEVGREVIDDTPTAELLERPAPGVTQPAFVGQLVSHLSLWGNGYCGVYYAPDGSVAQVAALPPDRMEVEVVGGEPRFKFHQGEGRIAENLTLDDVIHIRSGFTLDGVYGCSPVRVCRETMGLANNLSQSASALWANGAVPGGILSVPQGSGGDDQAQALADGWADRHEGAKNRGRVAVVTGEVKWQSTVMPLSDAQFLGTAQLSTAQVARVMGVPVWMIGAAIGDSSITYSTVSQQSEAFVKYSLGPSLRLIEAALSASDALFPVPGTYARFDLDELLRAEPETRAGFYEKALSPTTGWMTRGEVREAEGLPAEPDPPTPPAPIPPTPQEAVPA